MKIPEGINVNINRMSVFENTHGEMIIKLNTYEYWWKLEALSQRVLAIEFQTTTIAKVLSRLCKWWMTNSIIAHEK